jgi:HK97 family phage prohead protease
MATRWVSLDEWKRKAAVGQAPTDAAVRKAVPGDQVQVEAGEGRLVKFTISTGEIDRDRDFVSPKGWDLEAYRKNPVVLWAHDYAQLPIGRAVDLTMDGERLVATAEFVDKDLNPLAETVYRMIQKGFLGAASVGFKPKEFRYNEERKGVDFARQELLEFSVVPIPSNPGALVEARGIADLTPLRSWLVATAKLVRGIEGKAVPGCVHGALCPAEEGQPCPMADGCPMHKAFAWTQTTTNGANGNGGVTFTLSPVEVPVSKRGRVLSAANEARLREAVEALAAGNRRVEEVLALLDAGPEPGAEHESKPDPPGKAITKRIVERDGQWCVVSEDGAKTLGCHPSRAEAVEQLQAVEANKAVTKAADTDGLEIADEDEFDVDETALAQALDRALAEALTPTSR